VTYSVRYQAGARGNGDGGDAAEIDSFDHREMGAMIGESGSRGVEARGLDVDGNLEALRQTARRTRNSGKLIVRCIERGNFTTEKAVVVVPEIV